MALKYLKLIDDKVQSCLEFEAALLNDLAAFNINQVENQQLRQIQSELLVIRQIWELILDWQSAWEEWRSGNFWKINIDIMEDTAMALYKEFNALNKKYYPRNWDMLITTTKNVDSFRRTLPLITALKNPCMRRRHWDRVRDALQV